MKYFAIISTLILCIGFSSCTKETAPYYASTEQDRDTDSIDSDTYTYHLPVIFHVLYQNPDDTLQYIRTSRFKELIENVNLIYKAGLKSSTLGQGEDVNVNFELALEDENNKKLSTPGVEYIKYSGTLPIDCVTFMNDNSNTNTQYIWDPNEYINVMVYPFATEENSSTTTLGISVMPYCYDGYPDIQGLEEAKQATLSKTNLKFAYCLSLNSRYIYSQSSFFNKQTSQNKTFSLSTTDANITLAHELGHYLGLWHDFTEKDGEPADADDDTDYCNDTKSYNRIKYNKWLETYIADQKKKIADKKDTLKLDMDTMLIRSNSSGDNWKAINVMDYSVTLGYQFSSQQRHRMREVLYYSPLMPGPKKKRTSTKSRATREEIYDGPIDLPIRLAK